MAQNEALTRDVMLAVALAQGKSITAAAEEAGVGRSTIYRRLRNPRFRRRVAELRGQLVGVAVGRLADNMARAADKLAAMIDHTDDRLGLRSARTLLQMGMKLRESLDLDDRVNEVEFELERRREAVS